MPGRKNQKMVITRPPSLVVSMSIKHRMRFANITAGTANFNLVVNDLLDLYFVATAANAGVRLFDSIRVNRIQMWFAATAGTNSNTAGVEDINTPGGSLFLGAPSRTKVASMPTAGENGYFEWKPARGSLQNSWFSTNSSTTNQLLKLIIPANAIVDVSFDAVLGDGVAAPTAVVTPIAAATVGQIYVRALGCSTSTTNIPPVGVATI